MSSTDTDSWGRLVNVLQCSKYDGVRGSGSHLSSEKYVSGQSLRISSTSITVVCRTSKLIWALPSVFFMVVFVSPINLSRKTPNHVTFLGMNFHVVPWQPRSACTSAVVLVHLLLLLHKLKHYLRSTNKSMESQHKVGFKLQWISQLLPLNVLPCWWHMWMNMYIP